MSASPSETVLATAAGTNPFPGPRPFSEDEDWLFFGRDRELADLVALLLAQRVLLLHAPSGAGKSSLVVAGLIPRARGRGFEFLPVGRVRDPAARGQAPQGKGNVYVHNLIESWRAGGMEILPDATTVAGALGNLPDVEEPGRVMVLDQFEELFVLHPEHWKDRADFLAQIQGALDRDPSLHVLFVLRDDFLAKMQPLAPLLRDRLSTRYHLGGLSTLAALEAVVKPFASAGRRFAPGVAEELVRELREQPADLPGMTSYEGEDVEPVQLQIVCRTFFDRLPAGVAEIGPDDVRRHADVGQALVGFYEQAVAAAVKRHPRVSEQKVRLWFERQLITPARTRGIVFQGDRSTAGLPNEVVQELEERRVVRSEPRGPALWYELTHDRFIDAALASNRVWYRARSRKVGRLAIIGSVFAVVALVVVVALLRQRDGSSSEEAAGVHQGQIGGPGQSRTFPVSGQAGHVLTAVMITGEGLAGELRLRDSQGATVGAPTPPDSPQPVLTIELPSSGDYSVEVSGRNGTTGSFRLVTTVQSVDGDTSAVQPGLIPGALRAPDEVDLYRFAGRRGDLAQVSLAGDGLDSRLLLVGPGGKSVVDAEEFTGHSEANLVAVLPDDGSYELRASSSGGKTGSYRLGLELAPANPATSGTVTGTFDSRNSFDARAVRSETGGTLNGSFQPAVSGSVALLNADGRVLAQRYVYPSEGHVDFSWAVAPAATYILAVGGGDPGPYTLTFGVSEATPLVDGRAGGQVAPDGGVATFRLDGTQGDVVTTLVTPAKAFNAAVDIVQPDGTVLTHQDGTGPGEDELFTAQLRSKGPHLVIVRSSDGVSAGEFQVAVTQTNSTRPG